MYKWNKYTYKCGKYTYIYALKTPERIKDYGHS
jgi:hypothetical protein